jgi:DNA-binding MarR family transcriptional regulator
MIVNHDVEIVQPTDFIERFGAVKKRIHALAEAAYAQVDLGSMQAKLLRHIGKHSQISQAALARATDSDPTLTSRTVATLIERGLVRRERSAEDRREYILELTAAGKRARERAEKLRSELAERLVAALDAKDLADFDRVCRKMLAALE